MNVRNARPAEQIALLSLLHFLNDIHISFLPTFVPELVKRLGLSLAEAGALNSLAGLITMLGQPLFGYWSDRTERPWYIIAGPVLACLGATLLLSPNYGIALFLAGLWSIGSAVFHPQGSGGVGHLCGGENLSSYIALFGLGGMLAAATSPLYAVTLVRVMGLKWMWTVAIVPVAAAISLAFVMIPKLRDPRGVALTTGVSPEFRRRFRQSLESLARFGVPFGFRAGNPVLPPGRHRGRGRIARKDRGRTLRHHDVGRYFPTDFRPRRRALRARQNPRETAGGRAAAAHSRGPDGRVAFGDLLYAGLRRADRHRADHERDGAGGGSARPCDGEFHYQGLRLRTRGALHGPARGRRGLSGCTSRWSFSESPRFSRFRPFCRSGRETGAEGEALPVQTNARRSRKYKSAPGRNG